MKRLFIILAATFALACPAMSQEIEGHTYACTDVDAMRDFVTSAIMADSASTGISKGIDKGLTTFFRLCDITMEFRFQPEKQVQTHVTMNINDELAKLARLGWAKRQLVNLMLKTTVTGMNITEPYTIENRLVTTRQGNSMLIAEDGDSLEIGTYDGKRNLVFRKIK